MNITQIKKDLTEGVIVSSTTWSELVEWAVKAEEALARPIEVDGLGSITNEEEGMLTLRFKDDEAAQVFFCSHQPTVDCRDMPRPTMREDAQAAEDAESRIASQVSGWQREIARLQDLVAHATGHTQAALSDCDCAPMGGYVTQGKLATGMQCKASCFYDQQPAAAPSASENTIKDAVNRFLGWKLPMDFNPDCGISIDRDVALGNGWPIGTNLLSADQTKMMFQHCLLNQKEASVQRPTDDELWDATIRDRDAFHDWADKLADAIAKHFGVDIGEHSNVNLPWSEALDAIEAAAQSVRRQDDAQDDVSDDYIRTVFMQAAVNCGHTIKSEEITLYRDSRSFGNALGQLADRLLQAYKDVQSGQQPTATHKEGYTASTPEQLTEVLDHAVMRALNDARNLAMKNTVEACYPVCGDFGAIAQCLDYAITQINDSIAAKEPQ